MKDRTPNPLSSIIGQLASAREQLLKLRTTKHQFEINDVLYDVEDALEKLRVLSPDDIEVTGYGSRQPPHA